MKLDKILTKLGIYGHLWPRNNILGNYSRYTPIAKKPNPSNGVCSIPICDRFVYAKGFCNSHYQRALKLHASHADRTEWFETMNSPIRKKKRKKDDGKREEKK
tara:strand:- start:200 stop:508 length:309 start_codon:yes stop_codon:yes gene_type:complete